MQTVLPSEFKRGMGLMIDGCPQIIEEFHVSGTAQTKHKLHVRLRNLKNGRLTERIFAEAERVPLASLQTRPVQFSYQQGDTYVFMDGQTYDELQITQEQIGDRKGFLRENEDYKALLLDGKLLDIVLPLVMPLKIAETAPAQKGGSDATWKPARLETGLEIMVPLFIDRGDVVRVDTQNKKYLGKDTA